MKNKGTLKPEAKVGLFILIGMVILFYMTMKISGVRKVKGGGNTYIAKFEDVSGLVEKGKVEISGVSAGYVDKIDLDENGLAKLTLVINKNIKLKKDASAYVKTYGFMGEKFIEIYPGKSNEILPEGGVIKNAFTEKSISEVANKISDAADEVKNFVKNLNNSIIGKDGKSGFSNILTNFEKFSKDIEELTSNNREKLQEIIDNMDVFTKNIAKTSNDFNNIFSKVDKTFNNFSKISDKIIKGQGTLGKIVEDEELYDNLNKSFANLKEISEKINNGEGTLGLLISNKEFAEDLKVSLKDLRKISENISRGKGTIGKLVSDDTVYNDLKSTMTNLKNITAKINNNKGTLGKLVNEEETYNDIRKTLLRIQQAADGFSEQTPITTLGVVLGTLF